MLSNKHFNEIALELKFYYDIKKNWLLSRAGKEKKLIEARKRILAIACNNYEEGLRAYLPEGKEVSFETMINTYCALLPQALFWDGRVPARMVELVEGLVVAAHKPGLD